MLRFANNPDKIFTEILERAFEQGLDIIKNGEGYNDFQGYYYFYHHASRIFPPGSAKEILSELIKYNKDSGLWWINDYHYRLIYDSLESFCEISNDMAKEDGKPILTVDGFKIWEIDLDLIVDFYFFDTDFFIDPDVIQHMSEDMKQVMGFAPETFPVAMGMRPHPDELKIKLVKKGNFKPKNPDPDYYKKGARIYPAIEVDIRRNRKIFKSKDGEGMS